MANRIVGNIIIVDSAMGNNLLFGTGAVNLDELNVIGFSFWAVNTTAAITLTEANTAADLVYISSYITGQGDAFSFPNPMVLSTPLKVGNLKAPVVTACTAFIYLA